MSYTLEQIMDKRGKYQEICNLFFELVSDEETRIKLKEILYKGVYKDFDVCSQIGNKDNPFIEKQRRIAMAYLLIRNPETFDFFVENKINLFHGTNANALPSILKYGLNSGLESEKMGIYVSTGEKWSRVGGQQRDFVSFTDVLDIAEGYSTIKHEENDNNLAFEVVIGTTVDDVFKAGRRIIPSDVPEVGVRNKLPLESIRVIGVPSDKVDFVKRLVNNDEIKVLALDGINEKFYFADDFSWDICVNYDIFNKLKSDLHKSSNGFIFKLEEVRDIMYDWLVSKGIVKLKDIVGGEKSNYDGRVR